jgi:hypothetical protein
MSASLDEPRDVMMVCTNGHVVTDRLRTQPDQSRTHCARCGAPTLFRCMTCGLELPGATATSGLVTVGKRQPPGYCSACGAAFPWAKRLTPLPAPLLPALETLLRRLPRTVRELKLQSGSRPAFRLDDERDLEFLLRALLPLCCDDVRLHGRTPAYSNFSRTDFLLMPDRIALTIKLVGAADCEDQLLTQVREDVSHYGHLKACRVLVVLVYDAQGLLVEPERLETAWSGPEEGFALRCLVAR